MTEVGEQTIVDGRYRVLRRVGSGGMAEVYCAEDTHLGRMVALKLLYRRFAQDKEFVERFRREASAAAGLQHPNVVSVYDRGTFDGTYYIAMEFCEGSSLKEIIIREAPLPPARVIDIAKQILRAARFAHRRGIIHRDLKPHNVIVDSDGRVKVTDFGIARAGASEITEAGAIMGTAQYLSPEQAQGRPVTEASDLYSIGVVMFEMLTGHAPFDGDSPVAIALKHVSQPPPSPRGLVPEIPRGLEAVVLKALAKDESDRYADADSFIRDLDTEESALKEGEDFGGEKTAIFGSVPSEGTAVAAGPAAPAPAVGAGVEAPAPAEGQVGPAGGPPPVGPEPALGKPAEKRRRRWPRLLALAALAAILVGGYSLLHVNQVAVPSVVGQTLDSARQELEAAGFEVDIKRRSDPAPRDTVIDQVPAPSVEADEGSTVTVTVSNGPNTVKMPDVAGLDGQTAKQRVRRVGLRPVIERESSVKVPAGQVIRSDPGVGVKIERGSTVTLVVSMGARQVKVPNVVGQDQRDAISELRDAGLNVIVRDRDSSEDSGTVVGQKPGAGEQVNEGSTVRLFVSNGKLKEVPDVVGLDQSEATAKLRDAGFDATVSTRQVDRPDQDGRVLSQTPAAGKRQRRGTSVTITVGALAPGGEEIPPAGGAAG